MKFILVFFALVVVARGTNLEIVHNDATAPLLAYRLTDDNGEQVGELSVGSSAVYDSVGAWMVEFLTSDLSSVVWSTGLEPAIPEGQYASVQILDGYAGSFGYYETPPGPEYAVGGVFFETQVILAFTSGVVVSSIMVWLLMAIWKL